MKLFRGIETLAETSDVSKKYIRAATYNQLVASHVYDFSRKPDWKKLLEADSLALFFPWARLGDAPLSIEEHDERSTTLLYAQWECVLDLDVMYPCLCTNQDGVIKRGYWTAWNTMTQELPTYGLGGVIKTDADAAAKLREHREALFSGYFEPDDVKFIMGTIPCTTTVGK